jgi:hypothetical protein
LLLPVSLVLLSLIAASAEAKRFRGFVACGVADSTYPPPRSHSCPVRDLPQAVLVNRKRASVRQPSCAPNRVRAALRVRPRRAAARTVLMFIARSTRRAREA